MSMKRTCDNCIEIIKWKNKEEQRFKCREGRLGENWRGTPDFPGCSKHRFYYERPVLTMNGVALELSIIGRAIDELTKKVNSYNRVMRKLFKNKECAE